MKKKIPFDIKYKPQLQAQKYEAVTEGNLPVEILKWDAGGSFPIVAIIKLGDGSVEPRLFDENGRRSGNLSDDFRNLYLLVDKDPEFTELEEKLIEFRNNTPLISVNYKEKNGREIIGKYAQDILKTARKVVEDELEQKSKKYIQDTASINDVENHLKNLLIDQALRGSHAILDSQRRLREEVDLIMKIAKSEVCKNIPKLKKCPDEENHGAGITQIRGLWSILFGGYYITLEDFDKLPKEE